jgi:succinoglycan biosynthesis protein ExoA
MKPFVSVVIPCRNEARFLPRCLDSILSGDYPADRMEVLAVDGSSSDGTRECIRSYAQRDGRVRLVENPRGTTPAALNRGLDAARGEVIARVDAHAAVAREYLSRAVAHLESSGADNVGGIMRTLAQEDGPWAGAIVAALTHPFGVGNSLFRTAARRGSAGRRRADTVFGGCWRREIFDRLGRFNERLERGQDMEFNLRLSRAGGKILLAPDVVSDYYARADLRGFWRHNWINGAWAVLPFAYSDGVPVRWRHLMPLALLVGILVTPWAAAAYAAANLAASLQVAMAGKRWAHVARMPVVFASLHLVYGAGSLWGVARVGGILLRRRLRGAERP